MMSTESARMIAVGGVVDGATVGALARRCRELIDGGVERVTVDAASVSVCDHGALEGLRALQQGHTGGEVSVIGMRWTSFFMLLRSTPLRDVESTREEIRSLISSTSR